MSGLVNLRKRVLILILLSVSCVGCDQTTKALAEQHLARNVMDSYLFDIFRIGYAENVGSFLSFGADFPESVRFWLLTVATGVLLIALLAYLLLSPKLNTLEFVGLSLFFAGGISNLYDRAFNNGAVIDFLNIGLGPLRTGIFNFADVALMIGLALIFFSNFVHRAKTD